MFATIANGVVANGVVIVKIAEQIVGILTKTLGG